MIGIVDYGIGNLRSVEKAFHAAGADARLSSDAGELADCRGLVLPGVGAFGDAMSALRASGLDAAVERAAADGRPVLGLCVGLQMLFDESEEFGSHAGLGLLPGRVRRFPPSVGVVPHVGWNRVRAEGGHPLFDGIAQDEFFYFVHSYYVEPAEPSDVLATTEYGARYASACGRGTLLGAQFHPEKSQQAGLRMLGNFARFAAR